MFQLQQVWIYSKEMPIKEERERSQEVFQMQQRETYCKRLQREIVNEEIKDSRRIR